MQSITSVHDETSTKHRRTTFIVNATRIRALFPGMQEFETRE
jgi:hypothetical protein